MKLYYGCDFGSHLNIKSVRRRKLVTDNHTKLFVTSNALKEVLS